jgi:hypothetical protein
MSAQLDPQVHLWWMIAPENDLEDDWPHVECCVGLHQPSNPQPPPIEDDDEWWPGRCIV